MPPWAPPGPMETVIDLTFDDFDVRSSEIIDLTSGDHPRPSTHASQRPEVKVEDESSTLVGSSITDSGESSPNTQRTDDTAQTESNLTDPGDLSPRNPHDEDSDSSDDDLATVFARNRKRKHAPGDTPTSENRSSGTKLAFAALAPSKLGCKSLKPTFDGLRFNRDSRVDNLGAAKTRQDGRSKAQQDKRVTIQQERQPPNNASSKILNIDREEVFGSKETSKPKPPRKLAKQQSQVDVEPPSIPAPRRAVSEDPESTRPKAKTGSSGVAKSSQPREVVEVQRPHKRLKRSKQDDIASVSDSRADPLEDTSSKVAPANRLQVRNLETHSVERYSATSKDGAANIHGRSSGCRSDDARIPREKGAAHDERRRKKDMRRAWKQAQKSQPGSTGWHQGEKGAIPASQDERDRWKRSGFNRAGISRLPKAKYGQRVTTGRDSNHRGAHHWSHGISFDATRVQPSPESDSAHTETAGQEEIREAQQISRVRPQQSQHVQEVSDQRESGTVHLKDSAARPATRLEQPKQTLTSDAHKKIMEQAKHFFANHPSNTAPQRRVKMTNFIPPDLSKPSFSFRSRMVDSSSGRRPGRKLPNSAQLAEKRDKDRQRRILARRRRLEEEANQLFPNESEEHKGKWIEDAIAKMREKFTKNDQKREAQRSQGFLTVEDLEDVGAAGSDQPPAIVPKGKRRGIPVAEALEPGATITLYVVYISDPVEKGKDPGIKEWKRLGDQFLRKEEANKHAENLLRDERYDDSHLVSVHFGVGPEDGLFFGTKELADGNQVHCFVQTERQIANYLDLGDTFVRKQLRETYCSRFDVFYTNIIPKVFLDKKMATTDPRGENAKAKSKSNTSDADVASEPDRSEKEQADDDRNSLFSATSTPEPETAKSAEAGVEEVEDGDESDADSVASDGTLAGSEPGGNLGSLLWNDVEYMHQHVCGFTTMELANQEAYEVAKVLWKPRGQRMDSWLHYRNSIMPSLRESRAQELDVKLAELVFAVPEFAGHVDEKPWPFLHSTVFVKETRLEGPRDIGNHIIMDNGEDSGEDGEDDKEDD